MPNGNSNTAIEFGMHIQSSLGYSASDYSHDIHTHSFTVALSMSEPSVTSVIVISSPALA